LGGNVYKTDVIEAAMVVVPNLRNWSSKSSQVGLRLEVSATDVAQRIGCLSDAGGLACVIAVATM